MSYELESQIGLTSPDILSHKDDEENHDEDDDEDDDDE